MSRQRVVVADPMHADGIAMLREQFDVLVFNADQRGACADALPDADAVVVRTYSITGRLIESCPRLRAIVKHGAGTDNIDLPAAAARGIAVASTGDANAVSVAEATLCLMMAALRRVPEMHRVVQQGRYDERWSILLGGISGQTVGLIGFGNIGRRVGAMCKGGFGMKVLVHDPFLSAEAVAQAGGEKASSLEQLLSQSDVVSLHASMSKDAGYLIGERELGLMKQSAVLVNTSRGGAIDEAALARALESKRIFGAGLDVYEAEPPLPDNPLFSLPNVVLTPHVGGATEATRRLMATRSAEAVTAILQGRRPEFPVA